MCLVSQAASESYQLPKVKSLNGKLTDELLGQLVFSIEPKLSPLPEEQVVTPNDAIHLQFSLENRFHWAARE